MKTKNVKYRILAVILVMMMVLPLVTLGANASWVGFALSQTEWQPTSEASSIDVEVSYIGVSWTASSDVYWLTVSPTSGSGVSSGTNVTINAEANESGAVREGRVTFAVVSLVGSGFISEATITVTQAGGSIIAVSAGASHTLVLRSDGTVWAWGVNSTGQLGNGTTSPSEGLVEVSGLRNVKAISAGSSHSLALKHDGTVWAWGSRQLGDGTSTASTPVQVRDLDRVESISAGNAHSLALRDDGTVWAWGSNNHGRLGYGPTSGGGLVSTPVQVRNLDRVESISAGNAHSLALRDDGTVWAWGDNTHGQLGDGNIFSSSGTPVQVVGLSDDVMAISAGGSHSLALRHDGTVWAWGNNANRQLGDGTTTGRRPTPLQVRDLDRVESISAGNEHSLALRDNGTVWAWGNNANGRLGDGTSVQRPTPVQVLGLSGVEAISSGRNHSVALRSDGTVWSWGWNRDRQLGVLGDEQVPYSTVPVQSYTG